MDKRKTLVLFDIGAVLLRLDYGRFYTEASNLGNMDSEEFKRRFIEAKLEEEILVGTGTTEGFLRKIHEILSPEKKIPLADIRKIVQYCWPGPVDGVVELKKKIYDSGYSVGLLSNISQLALDTIMEKCPEVIELYDPSFPKIYSFEVKSIKPNKLMYEQIKGYDKVIFIDDKESYCRTGIEKFGWLAILFTPFIDTFETLRAIHTDTSRPDHDFYVADSVEQLKDCLKKLKVEIN